MNGRIYDPLLGRFLSADIVVQFASDLQSYNRYSYVRNNPLTTTDPTGFEEPVWLPAHVETLRTAKTPEGAANLGAIQGQATRESAAGLADSVISTVTAPLSMIASGSAGPVGVPGMGGIPISTPEQFGDFQAQQEAGQKLGSAITQAGRDPVTKAFGVADNNEGRNAMEKAADVTAVVAGAIQAAPGLIKTAESAIATGLKAEVKAAESLAAEAKGAPKTGPAEPYNRKAHYGSTPTQADRRALGAGPDQVVDHDPPLVTRYYDGDPAKGGKPESAMTPDERRASANDRSRMKLQSKDDSNKQGGKMSKYSKDKKKEHFGDDD